MERKDDRQEEMAFCEACEGGECMGMMWRGHGKLGRTCESNHRLLFTTSFVQGMHSSGELNCDCPQKSAASFFPVAVE